MEKIVLQKNIFFPHQQSLWFLLFLLVFLLYLLFERKKKGLSWLDFWQQNFTIQKKNRYYSNNIWLYCWHFLLFFIELGILLYFFLLSFFFFSYPQYYYTLILNPHQFIKYYALIYGFFELFNCFFFYFFYLFFKREKEVFLKWLQIEVISKFQMSFLINLLLVFFIFSSFFFKTTFLFHVGIVFFASLFLLHWWRIFLFSFWSDVPIFHIISYICTFEILPILLMCKFFFNINLLAVLN